MRSVLPPETCQKSGVILMCFVDGRKRFRAAPRVDAVSFAATRTEPDLHDRTEPDTSEDAFDC